MRNSGCSSDVCSSDLGEGLVEGRTDAGLLIPPAPGLPAAIDYRPLLREPLVAAVPDNWAKDGRLLVEEGRLAGESWLDQPLLLFPRHVSPTFPDLIVAHHRVLGDLQIVVVGKRMYVRVNHGGMW